MSNFKLVKRISKGNVTNGTGTIEVANVNFTGFEVNRDGLRAVDSAIFTCPSTISVSEHDRYSYIQDVADVTYLRGAYFFQGNFLDESGYDIDPIIDAATNNYYGSAISFSKNDVVNHKFRGLYQTNGTMTVLPLYNRTLGTTGTPVHDFSGDFEINAWVTTGTSTGTIYSKKNVSGTGIEFRIVKSGSTYKLWVVVDSTTASQESVYTTNTVLTNTLIFVRVTRIGSTVNVYLLDGTSEASFATPSSTIQYGGDLNFSVTPTIGGLASTISSGVVTATTTPFTGKLHQLRIYCGGTLTNTDALRIYAERPQPMLMKFAGNVWKFESNTDKKKIYVKGLGSVITNQMINVNTMTSAVSTGEVYHAGASRTLNTFTSCYATEIIDAILRKINTSRGNLAKGELDFYVKNMYLHSSTGSTFSSTFNTYTADGNFLEIANQLMVVGRQSAVTPASFFISPRGVCLIENRDIDFTNRLTFTNGLYIIKADGIDDSTTINDLTVIGDTSLNFRKTSDATSIQAIGTYSKRIHAPQITDATSLTLFGDYILSDNKNINRRYTVEAPSLLNFIRENYKVNLINAEKDIDVTSTIKSITWLYPQATTIINLGEHDFNGFDLEKASTETINGLLTNTDNT